MKILFICKYNRFRSKVAEVYFNKINTNNKIKASSAGIIRVDQPLKPEEKKRKDYISNIFGLKIDANSKSLKVSDLLESDKIIVLAREITLPVLEDSAWRDKIEFWKLNNEEGDNEKNINTIVNQIIKRVNLLNKELNKKGGKNGK